MALDNLKRDGYTISYSHSIEVVGGSALVKIENIEAIELEVELRYDETAFTLKYDVLNILIALGYSPYAYQGESLKGMVEYPAAVRYLEGAYELSPRALVLDEAKEIARLLF